MRTDRLFGYVYAHLRILFTASWQEECMNREKWLKGFKFALASVIAIALAELFHLKYATTAGIITILSIQNTKLETFRTAGHRAAAFVCALLVAAVCFGLIGFTIPAFAVYLFVCRTTALHFHPLYRYGLNQWFHAYIG